jgi:membrane-associated phospholipid phosphatase
MLTCVGDIGQVLLPLSGGCLSLYHKDRKATISLLFLVAINQVAIEVLKTLIPETRPNGSRRSFPSGHTASAFMGASFIANHYGWKPAIPSFVLAILVGHSRIHNRAHWKVDVYGGAILGWAVSWLSFPIERFLSVTKSYKP